MAGNKIEGLDWKGIETNQWRESEWCLSPNEDLKRIEELIASSQWSHLSVIKTGCYTLNGASIIKRIWIENYTEQNEFIRR